MEDGFLFDDVFPVESCANGDNSESQAAVSEPAIMDEDAGKEEDTAMLEHAAKEEEEFEEDEDWELLPPDVQAKLRVAVVCMFCKQNSEVEQTVNCPLQARSTIHLQHMSRIFANKQAETPQFPKLLIACPGRLLRPSKDISLPDEEQLF